METHKKTYLINLDRKKKIVLNKEVRNLIRGAAIAAVAFGGAVKSCFGPKPLSEARTEISASKSKEQEQIEEARKAALDAVISASQYKYKQDASDHSNQRNTDDEDKPE